MFFWTPVILCFPYFSAHHRSFCFSPHAVFSRLQWISPVQAGILLSLLASWSSKTRTNCSRKVREIVSVSWQRWLGWWLWNVNFQTRRMSPGYNEMLCLYWHWIFRIAEFCPFPFLMAAMVERRGIGRSEFEWNGIFMRSIARLNYVQHFIGYFKKYSNFCAILYSCDILHCITLHNDFLSWHAAKSFIKWT